MANVLELYDRFKGGGRGGKMVYPLENQADYLGKMTFRSSYRCSENRI